MTADKLAQASDVDDVVIRPIESRDNGAVAAIVSDVLAEYGCHGEGFASADPELDDMHGFSQGEQREFYVVELDRQVLGCGGFAPLAGSDDRLTCELQKMYFRPALRGRGAGRRLLTMLLARMAGHGFQQVYLETTSQMHAAQHLYRSCGFEPRQEPLGCTGHGSCELYFARPLP